MILKINKRSSFFNVSLTCDFRMGKKDVGTVSGFSFDEDPKKKLTEVDDALKLDDCPEDLEPALCADKLWALVTKKGVKILTGFVDEASAKEALIQYKKLHSDRKAEFRRILRESRTAEQNALLDQGAKAEYCDVSAS